jgi:hypothetical protein
LALGVEQSSDPGHWNFSFSATGFPFYMERREFPIPA